MHEITVVHEEDTSNDFLNDKISGLRKNYIAHKFSVMSTIYAVFICLVGIIFSTIEPFKACSKCEYDIKIFIEVFFIFMQSVSILWIVFISVLILIAKNNQKIAIKHQNGFNRRVSTSYKSSYFAFLKNSTFPAKKDNEESETKKSSINRSSSSLFNNLSSDISKFYFIYDYENGSGELYMRVGLALFAICSMIDRSFSLIQMVETLMNSYSIIKQCKILFILSMISKITSLSFIFLQTFFIFKYANIVINFGKNTALIGLIHLVSTNFCVFFRTVVRETVHEIHHHKIHHNTHSNLNMELSNSTMHGFIQIGCVDTISFTGNVSNGISDAQEKIMPYLYPCVIEYSLMCLTVFCILWASINKRYNSNSLHGNCGIGSQEKLALILNTKAHAHDKSSHSHEKPHVNKFVIDCGKSTTGLFFGIFTLLFTIISLIIYYIFKSDFFYTALQIGQITEFILVCWSFLIVLLLLIKLKFSKFDFKLETKIGYNEKLAILGLAGIYVFGFYSMIALFDKGIETSKEWLSLLIQIISVVEATLQTVLIIEGLKMYTNDRFVKKNKPGRSMLTLLILLNVSLWLCETFIIKKYESNSVQLAYYDIVFWSIVSSVSSPLAIFFRFHASVCLSDIWKTLYE